MEVVALVGASSFIGQHLVKHLLSCDDLRLRVLVHNNCEASFLGSKKISTIQGDLSRVETLKNFIEPGCVVVNLAYLKGDSSEENITAIENLLDVCAKVPIRRLIHCSTAVVVGRVHTDRVTENTLSNPLKEYEIIKGKIENILLEKSTGSFEVAILRPTAVFGRGGKNLLKLAENLRKGNRIVSYLKSCLFQHRRMNLVPVDTVVSAIDFLIHTEKNVDREVFIISDDEEPSNNYRDVERYLMNRLGCRTYPFPTINIPLGILSILLRIAGRTNVNPSLVYDCGKILSIGLRKPISFEEGLFRFVEWYRTAYCIGAGSGSP